MGRAIASPCVIAGMREEALAVVLVLLVAGSLGASYFAGGQAPTGATTSTAVISTTTTVDSEGVCGNSNASQSGGGRVILMQQSVIGFVCVYYSANSAQRGELLQSVGGLYSLNSTGNPSPAKGVNITIWSEYASSNGESIEYLIRTTGNATGVYTWWAPGTCPGFPLVIGMNLTSAQATLNRYYSQPFYCPAAFFGAQLDGSSGVTLQYFD